MQIAAYDNTSWVAVVSAFRHFLNNRTEYSRKRKQQAIEAIQSRQDAIKANKAEHRRLNLHLFSSDYTNIPLPMRHGQPAQERVMNLRTHRNGVPIEWRVFPLPECEAFNNLNHKKRGGICHSKKEQNPCAFDSSGNATCDTIVQHTKKDMPDYIRVQLEIMETAA